MRLPAPNSEYGAYVRYGRYVVRRLRRAGMVALARDAEKITLEVKTTGRAWEDADEPVQDAMADRDAADDDLDATAQSLRTTLAGRATGADRVAPYTEVFPQGLAYYTAAPVDEEEARYGELKLRAQEHLASDDPARKAALAGITAGLKSYKEARDDLRDAEARETIAGTRARAAIAAFVRQMEKTYGALMAENGKAYAERFFPRYRSGRSPASGGGRDDDPPAPPA